MTERSWKLKGKGPSPTYVLQCKLCQFSKDIETSKKLGYGNVTNYLASIFTILTGSTYTEVSNIFGLLGINMPSESYFNETIIKKLEQAVKIVLDRFLRDCKIQIEDKENIAMIIDAGWSHPGWWARECTIIGLDGRSGLPIAIYHALKDINFKGSSRAMEGFGVKKIMEEMKNLDLKIKKVIHDKDSSTMTQVMDIFEDVMEVLCLSKFFFIFKFIFRSWM
jgi:hypothetical protein